MKPTIEKPNLLTQFAKNKLAGQIKGKTSGNPSTTPVSRFPRPTNSRPVAKHGGRNGQGKP